MAPERPGPDFQALFESAPALFMVLSPTFEIVAVSNAYLGATQTKREGVLGRGLFEIFPDNPDDPNASGTGNLRASLERVLATRAPDAMAVQKYDIQRSDGSGFEERFWSPYNSPVFDANGVLTHIIHRVEDVTDFMRARQSGEEQTRFAQELRARAGEMEVEIFQRAQQVQEANQRLRAANERLSELDKLKTAFFSNISHELRTPLTLMLGPSEDLLAGRAGALPARAREEIEAIHRNASRLLRLVNALLELSSLEAGRLTPRREPTDVSAFTAALANSFRSAMDRAGLTLEVDCPPLATPVAIDRDMWEKIVLNLVSNAFKFTLKGKVAVRLREEKHDFLLEVEDTGTGIPSTDLGAVFDRFHRVKNAQSRSHEGTGIGLALVKELVNLHQGDAAVESEVGKGTKFTLRIPKLSTQEETAPAPLVSKSGIAGSVQEAMQWVDAASAPSRPQKEASVGPEKRARVLVVDDNTDVRNYIVRVLAEEFEVQTAVDGQVALEAALADPPDLIVSDVMMPRLDGVGLLRALRAAPLTKGIPILLLTARGGEEAVLESLAAGADDHLAKPFSARELLARVRSNLELCRMRREIAEERTRVETLSDAVRARDDFLSVASHELKTPLAAFRLQLENIAKKLENESHEQIVDRLQRSKRVIQRLGTLVDTLLDVSQLTSGRLKLAPSNLNLSEVITDLTDLTREEASKTGTPLSVRIEGPANGRFDPVRISQVVTNLLSNAVKFGAGRPVEVVLRTEGQEAHLTVTDHGIGIDSTHRLRIFERFERAVSARNYGGLGLGLWVTRQVIEAHQGRIEVQDTPGGGTTFEVTLPLEDDPRRRN